MEQFTTKTTINQGGWKQFDDGSVIQDSLWNGIFDSILDTSSPQANDKQDGGRSVRHIAFDMFAWGLGQSGLHWSTALCLCMCLCRPSFHLSKLRHGHKHKHKKNELRCPFFLCLCLCFMSTQFSLAYTCACAYAYAYALVKTRLIIMITSRPRIFLSLVFTST